MTYVDHYTGPRDQSWRTPAGIFDALDDEFRFDLDGAGDAGNGLCPAVSTIERPISWAGRRVFCNPPWSSILPFVEQAPAASVAVLLVPARTNARWFHRALALGADVRFFLGKPRFGDARWNSPVDCLLLVWDKR